MNAMSALNVLVEMFLDVLQTTVLSRCVNLPHRDDVPPRAANR